VNNLLQYTTLLDTYYDFNKNTFNKLSTLSDLKVNLKNITPYNLTLDKVGQLGKIMREFYAIYNLTELNDAFMWSFGINGYIDTIEGVVKNIADNQMSFCKFVKSKKTISTKSKKKVKSKNLFKGAYYPVLKDSLPIRNDIHLDKNLIITGPNASGKTTILKSSLINIILSQQLGCGFYSSANIDPYKYIHCYLNIPDTSGRDSLFQAEARRCKDILDIIHDNKNESHFCVFDELYSGTNPEEAVSSAKSFMKYLVNIKGVNCMLTTHFIDLCKMLDNNLQFKNCHMNTEADNDEQFKYTYLLKDGISQVRGGMKVLRDMDYPKEIIGDCD
jgi:DNA mismatch repair ATPase MutS